MDFLLPPHSVGFSPPNTAALQYINNPAAAHVPGHSAHSASVVRTWLNAVLGLDYYLYIVSCAFYRALSAWLQRLSPSVGVIAVSKLYCRGNVEFYCLATLGKVTTEDMESVFTSVTQSPVQLMLVFATVFIVTYLFRRYNDSDGGRKLPPSLPSLPVVGSLPFLPTKLKDLAQFYASPRNKLGKIFSARFGSK